MSVRHSETGLHFAPELAIDGDMSTWSETYPGKDVTKWFKLYFWTKVCINKVSCSSTKNFWLLLKNSADQT